MSKQVNYNENLCAGAAIRDDKGRRISKLFEASHPKMTVGYAKNLIMPDDPTEQEFNFRQSGSGVIEDGVAVIDKVKGNSVVWNQLMNIHSKINDGEIEKLNLTNGHKYLVFWKQDVDIPSSIRNTLRIDFLYFQHTGVNNHPNAGYYNWMFTFEGDNGIHSLSWWIQDYTEGVTPSISNILFYDLTQMFGAGNEPSTYEEFLSRKPVVADEYAYNEGTIVNNKVEKVVTTGRNLWDEQWELGSYDGLGIKMESSNSIRSKNMYACLPHTSYYWRIPNKANVSYMGFCYFYDISGAFISKSPVGPSAYLTLTTPSNARFVAFSLREEYGTTYDHDICINLSDPAFNGQYAPYEKHELDLSWLKDIKDGEGVKLFEDGMRSAGTAFDEVRKDKAVKRIGVVDLGNLNWEPGVQTGQYQASDFKQLRPSAHKSLVCANYTTREDGSNMQNDSKDLWVWNNVGKNSDYYQEVLIAKDTRYSSAQAFKQAVQGVLLYYELAEPIEVEYDEKNLTYPVVAGGTEEAIASEPSTAFRADIGYGIDAVKTILDLKARVEALEGK